MHDGAIFTPSPFALAGSDCDWIPAGGAAPLASKLKGKVAVVTLNRLPSEGIPAPCSYHRLAVAATQAEAAALVLGEWPSACSRFGFMRCQLDLLALATHAAHKQSACCCLCLFVPIRPARCFLRLQWHLHSWSPSKATAPTARPAR